MALWSRIQSLFRRAGRVDPLVRVTDKGFDLIDPGDLLTTDCICLLFELRSGHPPVQVAEEWKGFADLFEPLTAAFPSIPKNWYMDVMTPAFETKQTVLYDGR